MRPTATQLTAGASVLLTAHTVINLSLLRTPSTPRGELEPVAVLLPVRDEAHRLEPGLRSMLAALDAYPGVARLLVLDDESTDGTAALVRRVVGDNPRVSLLRGEPTPPGWLGKPWACQQLTDAAAADGDPGVLVFVDADVVLAPEAVASTVHQLRVLGMALVSPYPRQVSGTAAERLVQPLLQWSWLTTLPLRLAERSTRPSLGAANGQLMAVDAATYRRAGGHASVRADVLDDLALLRSVKAVGGLGTVTDGTHLATCRMYDGWQEVRDGYTKSLWTAFGSPAAAVVTVGVLGAVYVWPPLAALGGSRAGAVGYAAGVAGRAFVARRTGGRVWPDSLGHPVSVALLGLLTGRSLIGRRRGTLRWKGRDLR